MFKDFTGKTLQPGDFVVHSTRSGSSLDMAWAIVTEVTATEVKTRKRNSKKAASVMLPERLVNVNYLDVPEDVKNELEAYL